MQMMMALRVFLLFHPASEQQSEWPTALLINPAFVIGCKADFIAKIINPPGFSSGEHLVIIIDPLLK